MHRRPFRVLLVLAATASFAGCSGGDEVTARADSEVRPGSGGSETTISAAPSTTVGGGSSSGGSSSGEQGGPLCDAAQRIRELDDESNAVMNDAMRGALDDPTRAVEGLTEAVAELRPLIPELTGAYDDLAAAAPEELRGDIGLVRDFTLSLMQQLSELDSVEDLAAFEGQLDANAAMAAGAATLEIDAVTRAECGISIAG